MTENDEIDALFALSLSEFTGARNALAARLKQSGHAKESALVKALVKPSISAWAVNQLFWTHRKAFDHLLATGERFRKEQSLQLAGKASDMRGAADARRQAISDLSRLAAGLLQEADHNPTSDIMRRIATTLEAVSALASFPDASGPGRLTADLQPPGFESLIGLIPDAIPARKAASVHHIREFQETRRARIDEAKLSLQNAERGLKERRAVARDAEMVLKTAVSDAKEAEKRMGEAQEHARSMAARAEEAKKAVEDAQSDVDKAARELESFRSKSSRH